MRIAYCIEGFYNRGGMERILSVKANWLAEHGYDVTILSAYQEGKPLAFELNNSIGLIDLGTNKIDLISSYRQKLTEHLLANHYDIVISMGGLDVRFLSRIKDASKKVVELHFAWDRFISSGRSLKAKIIGFVQTLRYLWYYKQYKDIVVLTQHDKAVYRKLGIKAKNIYNPITINSAGRSLLNEKRVISVGRLDYQKGYDFLIKAWDFVEKKHADWHLDIYGDGDEKDSLQRLIDSMGLKNITLCGSSSNLGSEYASSSIYVMSSRYEGLGLVLLEAALHGLPLIAYDCPFGPNEIISDGKNGFLVRPVGNIQELADRICFFIENKEKRISMGENAFQDSKRFNVDDIMQQWVSLFDTVLKN